MKSLADIPNVKSRVFVAADILLLATGHVPKILEVKKLAECSMADTSRHFRDWKDARPKDTELLPELLHEAVNQGLQVSPDISLDDIDDDTLKAVFADWIERNKTMLNQIALLTKENKQYKNLNASQALEIESLNINAARMEGILEAKNQMIDELLVRMKDWLPPK